jgi:hypothetical protein
MKTNTAMFGNRVIVLQPAAWGSSIPGLDHARSHQAVAWCRRYVSDHFKSRAREARRPRAMQPSQSSRVRLVPAAAQFRIASFSAWSGLWIPGVAKLGFGMPPHIGSDFPATYPATSTPTQRAHLVIEQG